jgi:hypothetical protein
VEHDNFERIKPTQTTASEYGGGTAGSGFPSSHDFNPAFALNAAVSGVRAAAHDGNKVLWKQNIQAVCR